jgi:cell division septation protein DedD
MLAILMSDEGVHEIQLNGKQLVFMFMAVTVVAVVIFLCGVMVGRGVRAPRATELADAAIETPLDPTASVATAPSTAGPSSSAASDPTQDPTLSSGRLNATTPPPEPLKEPVQIVQEVKATAPAKTTAVEPPPAAPAVKTAAAAVKTTVPKTPAPKTQKPAAVSESGEGFVVQVAAVKERSEADTIAKRLSSKGFPSFVSSPSAGAARVYRVRVGKYRDRSDAETVARRLEKEEQFKPWITR